MVPRSLARSISSGFGRALAAQEHARSAAAAPSAAAARALAGSAQPEADADAAPPSTSLAAAGLTADQLAMQEVATAFARDELQPHSAEWDARHHFPVDVLRQAAGLGFGGLYVKEDVGGSGMSRLDAAVCFEALSWGDVPVTAYLSIHNMVASVIDRWGSPEQRSAHLPRLCSMDALASYCLTEPGSGSDAASLRTSAKRDGGDYVLSGSKAFISGGGISDVYLVMARTGAPGPRGITAFLVEKDSPGLSFGKPEDKLGWRAQPTTTVALDAVRVPESARVGAEGEGFKIAMAALDGGRVNIGACSVGGAQCGRVAGACRLFCLDYARDYVQHRRQFGLALADFQATQAARALDAKAPTATLEAAMAKRFATDECHRVTSDAMQLLGGYGYLRDYPPERYFRDLRVHSILEGTNEIMRLIINRELEKLD